MATGGNRGDPALSKWIYAELALLGVQFLLGMDVNLYLNIPQTLNAAFWTSPSTWIIRFHMIVGTIVLVIAAYILLKTKGPMSISKRMALAGLFWIAVAYAGGLAFLFGGADNLYSYLMAIAFLFAIIIYAILAGLSLRPTQP